MTLVAAGPAASRVDLTPEQRAIVQADDGPIVVIAGAGTGKTRVIVERVRWLLETKGDLRGPIPAEPGLRHGDPFAGPLVPEQILVLTYNVKAARELQERLDLAVGPAVRSRMSVSNFHSFCQRVLTESASDANLPARPDVLDGVGQLLLLRDLQPGLDLVYHGDRALGDFVTFVNRAKDELVTPDDFAAFVAAERDEYERRYGSYEAAADRLVQDGHLEAVRDVRSKYAGVRGKERAEAVGLEVGRYRPDEHDRTAEREARRAVIGTGKLVDRRHLDEDQLARIDRLADTYVRDGAALEVLRLDELARVYHAYQEELARRGALDFGEQIALATTLFKTRPNVLRRWQRQYRYILVDEFQDANVAQIELIELLGRTPDRPDNVMVVGDDDQSIYRFRGASFAAFAEFDDRFGRAPAHDRTAVPAGPPRRLRIDQNFRSVGRVLTVANRLIGCNETRFAPDKRLWTEREDGEAIELLVCAGPEDEAVAIVDRIKALAGSTAGLGAAATPDPRHPWTDVTVLYRKHKHRDAIVARLRAEDIPYTVVGGLSLFEAPEIRDLEQGLRAVANPHDDAALVRMMTAGPWRMDAIEILGVTRARAYDRSAHILETAATLRDNDDTPPETRAKLRALLGTIDELNPGTFRDGPSTILDRYLERTGQILDLLAVGTLEAKRSVTNIAAFMRFVADWQAANPAGCLGDFTGYLDAYKSAGGELPTSVELSEDVDGVRLMTLHQAKGLEFPIVIVPHLLDGEWPTKEQGNGWFPRELLRERVPTGDIHTDEERRLLYVAMTRAQERLILSTHGGTGAKAASQFVAEILEGAGNELTRIDRVSVAAAAADGAGEADEDAADAANDRVGDDGADSDGPTGGVDDGDAADAPVVADVTGAAEAAALAAARRVMPLPTARERRLVVRLRAAELIGLMEATVEDDPEAADARVAYADRLADLGRSAAMSADEARAAGLDPLTFRSIALDTGAGANLLAVAPLPPSFSYTALGVYERCPLQYAFKYVYRVPGPEAPRGALTFGSTAHAAFEAFTRERRERAARGEPPPTRDDLERLFKERWVPARFGDRTTEEAYARKVDNLLGNFWTGELEGLGEAIHEELPFTLVLDPGDGSEPVRVYGEIDRIDRLPGGGLEVIDHKTGRIESQKSVEVSLQLSIYALACRDALDLGTPERVTLYFTESALRKSATRTDEELDAARDEILAQVQPIRAGEFTATPKKDKCERCDYRAMCPERA